MFFSLVSAGVSGAKLVVTRDDEDDDTGSAFEAYQLESRGWRSTRTTWGRQARHSTCTRSYQWSRTSCPVNNYLDVYLLNFYLLRCKRIDDGRGYEYYYFDYLGDAVSDSTHNKHFCRLLYDRFSASFHSDDVFYEFFQYH
ncbi:uncharacterized protein JN550_011958 [Neoarthrinium moseri]|uniref:uncharacterized protein n=1 Tax=Neoarthrinium moseri TaxID=1658444 RepID=UPI001FDC9B45|nr:uncharacterized protein JN550_011958 [Neoarthrinium moseri]KAI1859550.1 hypothetical protein JN550_011958 [Neoarthrinium moseri]